MEEEKKIYDTAVAANGHYKKADDDYFEKKRKKGKLGVKIFFALIVIGLLAIKPVEYGIVAVKYNKAVDFADSGNFEEALEIFKEIYDYKYMDTQAYRFYCSDRIDYENGGHPLYSEYLCDFKYITDEQRKEIDEFKIKADERYARCEEEEERKQAIKEQEEYEKKVTTGVPFEGMKEEDIARTTLGAPSKCKQSTEMFRDRIITVNRYLFKDSRGTIFIAICKLGRVKSVMDFRDSPIGSYSGGFTVSSDPYDIDDYSNADDFYYDHYDDFYEYEEAEDYFNEHRK